MFVRIVVCIGVDSHRIISPRNIVFITRITESETSVGIVIEVRFEKPVLLACRTIFHSNSLGPICIARICLIVAHNHIMGNKSFAIIAVRSERPVGNVMPKMVCNRGGASAAISARRHSLKRCYFDTCIIYPKTQVVIPFNSKKTDYFVWQTTSASSSTIQSKKTSWRAMLESIKHYLFYSKKK